MLCTCYFWTLIFKDCVRTIKKCHPCQVFSWKMHAPPTPLHPEIVGDPFTKWGIDFMTCQPPSIAFHHYIIMVVNYFTKWPKAMPTYSKNAKSAPQFLFNHVITQFGIPKSIIIDHGSHFCNNVMTKLATLLKFHHKKLSPYYP